MKNYYMSRMKKLFLLLFVSFFTVGDIYCQKLFPFQFRKIDVDDGLSENSVQCIIQDSCGFMWFGTKAGLNRYDGTEFRIYRNDPNENLSLGNNYIRSLLLGPSDVLYVGTDAGLYIMRMADEKFTKLNVKTADGIEVTSGVNSMQFDDKGRLWLATMIQGVFTFDPGTNTLSRVESVGLDLRQNAAWCVIRDRSGVMWVGSRLGLLRYDSGRGVLNPESAFSGETRIEILNISEDERGQLWLGTWEDGVLCYHKDTRTYASYGGKGAENYITHVRAVFPYSKEIMLIGADDGFYAVTSDGLRRIDNPRSQQSLSDQNVYSIFQDRENGLWIGTYFGGVNYFNPLLSSVETFVPGNVPGMLSGRAVGQFCEDPAGNLWIATEDGGVNYFNTKTNWITQPIETSYHNIQALLLDGDDLWIGTLSRGLDIHNLKSGHVNHLRHDPADEHSIDNDCIFSLYRTRSGEIFVGTSEGVNRYDRQHHRFDRILGNAGCVRDMLEDEYGNLWLATLNAGAIRLKLAEGEWIHYDSVNYRSNPIVGQKLCSVYIDAHKNLIYTSQGGGIFFYDHQTDSFRNISLADGLPDNVIYGVLDDQFGNLWLSSNVGIIRFNPKAPHDSRIYNKTSGMQSAQFNFRASYKTRDGKFYFGGINGFSCFYPEELADVKNQFVPPVVITGITFLKGGKKALETKTISTSFYHGNPIEISYKQASFTISYVSLSYVSQADNCYAYMLEGFDTDWHDVCNNRSVSYFNLPPGKYTFKVRGSNNDRMWNTEAARIDIRILPPLWRSAFAITAYILAFILACFLTIRHLLQRLRRKRAAELESVTAEAEKKTFQSQIEFFVSIAHEIRTPLSLISAPLEEIIASGDASGQMRQNLRIIDKNRERLSTLVNQLLDFRKIDSRKHIAMRQEIDLKKLLSDIYERFLKTSYTKHIEMLFELPEGDASVISDSDALIKITDNLLANALKFTSDRILLQLQRNADRSFTIRVTDNGKGIPDRLKKLIFDPFYQIDKQDEKRGYGIGLSLVKNLSEVLEGQIRVSDAPGGGTVFSVTFANLSSVTSQSPSSVSVDEESLLEGPAAEHLPRLLAVDDNPDMTLFISQNLGGNYHVDVADNVSQALKLLEKNSYELIISDIMMPGTDGILFARQLRNNINFSHIPIILLSAKTDNVSKAEGLYAGADVFIEKPFSMKYLKAQIASLLNNRKSILDAFNRSPLMPYSALATNKSDEIFLKKLNEEIEKHMADENFSVESLADIFSLSRSSLQRKVKIISGTTPGEYLRNYRLKRACHLSLESNMRINEVAFEVGFNSASYFTKAFFKAYNMTPTDFLAEHAPEKADRQMQGTASGKSTDRN